VFKYKTDVGLQIYITIQAAHSNFLITCFFQTPTTTLGLHWGFPGHPYDPELLDGKEALLSTLPFQTHWGQSRLSWPHYCPEPLWRQRGSRGHSTAPDALGAEKALLGILPPQTHWGQKRPSWSLIFPKTLERQEGIHLPPPRNVHLPPGVFTGTSSPQCNIPLPPRVFTGTSLPERDHPPTSTSPTRKTNPPTATSSPTRLRCLSLIGEQCAKFTLDY